MTKLTGLEVNCTDMGMVHMVYHWQGRHSNRPDMSHNFHRLKILCNSKAEKKNTIMQDSLQ